MPLLFSFQHHDQSTNISYLDFSLKPAVFSCQCHSSSTDCVREPCKPSKDLANLLVCNGKIHWCGVADFVTDVISEVVLGPLWLMLPGLEPNH